MKDMILTFDGLKELSKEELKWMIDRIEAELIEMKKIYHEKIVEEHSTETGGKLKFIDPYKLPRNSGRYPFKDN